MASKEKYATDDDFHMEVKIQNEERDHKKHEEIKLMNNVVSVKKKTSTRPEYVCAVCHLLSRVAL